MEASFHLILIVLACVLFFLAGVGDFFGRGEPHTPWPWSGRLIAWGLCFWALSTIVKI